jgi:hypothetical protein
MRNDVILGVHAKAWQIFKLIELWAQLTSVHLLVVLYFLWELPCDLRNLTEGRSYSRIWFTQCQDGPYFIECMLLNFPTSLSTLVLLWNLNLFLQLFRYARDKAELGQLSNAVRYFRFRFRKDLTLCWKTSNLWNFIQNVRIQSNRLLLNFLPFFTNLLGLVLLNLLLHFISQLWYFWKSAVKYRKRQFCFEFNLLGAQLFSLYSRKLISSFEDRWVSMFLGVSLKVELRLLELLR